MGQGLCCVFLQSILFNPYKNPTREILSTVFQARKLRCWEIKETSQGPTASDRAMMGTQKTPELLLLSTELLNEWEAADEPVNLGSQMEWWAQQCTKDMSNS